MIDAAVVGDVWEVGTVTSFDKGKFQGFLKVEGRDRPVQFYKRPTKEAGFAREDLVPGTSVEVLIKEREDGGHRAYKFKPKDAS